jgi:hypothetical protein
MGFHHEMEKMRTAVSMTEILDLTLHSEQVNTVVPLSRGPAE